MNGTPHACASSPPVSSDGDSDDAAEATMLSLAAATLVSEANALGLEEPTHGDGEGNGDSDEAPQRCKGNTGANDDDDDDDDEMIQLERAREVVRRRTQRLHALLLAAVISSVNLLVVGCNTDVVRQFPMLAALLPLIMTIAGISALQASHDTERAHEMPGDGILTLDTPSFCAALKRETLRYFVWLAPCMALVVSIMAFVCALIADAISSLSRSALETRSDKAVSTFRVVHLTVTDRWGFALCIGAVQLLLMCASLFVGVSAPYFWRRYGYSTGNVVGVIETTLLDLIGTLAALNACRILLHFM